jgi:proline dehydrogenase
MHSGCEFVYEFTAMKGSLPVNPLTIFARRFIAGETIEDAMKAVAELNREGMTATLDILGENVKSEQEAIRSADAYIQLLERISSAKVNSNVSIKLTMMGLDVGEEFCYQNVKRITNAAREHDNFVRVDMEGSSYTQRTLDVFRRLRQEYEKVGIVIQSYLFRSEKDVEALNAEGCRVRLCKGAYKEPPDISFKSKEDTNANYVKLMKMLMANGNYPAIATHDSKMIDETVRYVKENGITNDKFEFQMLYGIRRNLQRELIKQGYSVRIYVPYGTHWLPYFVRRLRERKENIFFVLKHLFRD